MKCCPMCKCRRLQATAYVAQVWALFDDEYEETVEDCKEILHRPDGNDIWACSACGFASDGEAFNCEEP